MLRTARDRGRGAKRTGDLARWGTSTLVLEPPRARTRRVYATSRVHTDRNSNAGPARTELSTPCAYWGLAAGTGSAPAAAGSRDAASSATGAPGAQEPVARAGGPRRAERWRTRRARGQPARCARGRPRAALRVTAARPVGGWPGLSRPVCAGRLVWGMRNPAPRTAPARTRVTACLGRAIRRRSRDGACGSSWAAVKLAWHRA